MNNLLRDILVEQLQVDPDAITLDAELVRDLGLNSLELADLVLTCEEKFGVEIKDESIKSFISVGDIVNYIEKLQPAGKK
ncbi:MAG: acyl carrier protein [Eubacteriales bacterium]